MPTVDFPFWIVTRRSGLISMPVVPDDTPGFIAAFSTAGKATKFMVSRGATEWENKLVSRSTLADLTADLRKLGIQGLRQDPTKDGYGTKVTFNEMG